MKKVIFCIAIFLALASSIAQADVQNGTPAGPPTWTATPTAVDSFNSGASTDVIVTWSPATPTGADITGYQVLAYVSDAAGATGARSAVTCSTDAAGTSCTLKGLSWATYYKFAVLATNSIGTTASSFATNTQNYPSPTSHPLAILTPGLAQTVTITGAPTGYVYGSSDFQLSATATSGLPITWSSAATSTCTVDSSGVVHFLIAQTSCRITATQYGASSGYMTASAYVDVTAGIDLSATANTASAIQGTAATLSGVFPYPGANVTPTFCVVGTNPGSTAPSTCTGAVGTVGTLSTSLITATSSTTSSATVSGLQSAHQYWYWAIATSGASHAQSNVVAFTTQTGPTLTLTGSLNGTVGSSMSVTFTATGGSGSYSAWDKGSLPAGLSISYADATATISGTPTTAGSTVTWVYVEDSGGLNTTLPATFVISASGSSGGGSGSGGGGSAPAPTPTPSAETSLHITLNEATNIQSTSAELNANAKWLGIDGTPQFCISLIDDNSTCTIVAGATLSPLTPSFITTTVDGAITAKVVGLKPQTTYYIWAKISGSGKSDVTPSRTIRTAAGPSISVSGETRVRVGGNLRLVVTASSGAAPYKNWHFDGLPSGATYLAAGDTVKISGRANTVSTFDITATVEDSNKVQGSLTIPITFYDEANTLDPITGVTSQVIGSKLTQVSWNLTSGISRYYVYLKQHLVCDTQNSNCTIKNLLGPKAEISLIAKTTTGALTPSARPTYLPPVKPIEIALVHFAFNSSIVSTADKKLLYNLGKQMRGQGFTSLLVIGHTDAIGSAEFNAVLSGKRAHAAFDYLNLLLKKDPVSVTIKMYGFKLPVGDNATSNGRKANRRASILLR